MADLLAGHHEELRQLVSKSLVRIGEALDAHATEVVVADQTRQTTKTATKETRTYKTVLRGVDHYARMTAARRLLDLVEAARTDKDQTGVKVTLEMFLELYREVNPA